MCFFIISFHAFNRLERTDQAIADANKALEIKEDDTKAIAAKAEALFSSGDFEQSLVYFERRRRILNSEEMYEGLMKTRQAILNVIGDGVMEFNREEVATVIEDSKNMEKTDQQDEKRQLTIPKTITRKKYSSHRMPRLNISNVLKEEELFLLRLKNIEKFNVKINVRRGTNRRAQCQVAELTQPKISFCISLTFHIL